MSRPHLPIYGFAVFGPKGEILTAKDRKDDATTAAKILGGTDWQASGYSVTPVRIDRIKPSKVKHPDMIESTTKKQGAENG